VLLAFPPAIPSLYPDAETLHFHVIGLYSVYNTE